MTVVALGTKGDYATKRLAIEDPVLEVDVEPVPAVPTGPLPLPVVEDVVEPVNDEEPAPVPLVVNVPAVEPVVDAAVAPSAVELVAPAPAEAVVLPAAPPAIWNAITPPKGPALLLFAIFMKHTFCCPAAVPEHVVPAGT